MRYSLIASFVLLLLLGFAAKAQSGPQITDITGEVIYEGQNFTAIDLDAVVSDPDNPHEELTWVISENNQLQVNLDNHIAFIETPNENWFGEETIVFTVYDPDSNSDSDEAVFKVNPVNDPPVITPIPGLIIKEGESFSDFNLDDFVNDPDDPVASLTWSVEGSEHLIATIHEDHNVSIFAADPKWTGAELLAFTVRDAAGAEDTEMAIFGVENINDTPVSDDDSYQVNEGATLSTPAPGVLSNDSDADGDPLSAVLVDPPAHSSPFTLNSDGSFNYTHNGSETTSDQFTYRAYDGTAYSNTVTVTITITPVNDAPVAKNDTYTVAEGGTLSIDAASGVLNNDTDAENNLLTAQKISDPENGTLTLNPNGSFLYIHNGSETPITDQFTYRANDGAANSIPATVTINITPQNDNPVLFNAGLPTIIFVEDNGAVKLVENVSIADGDHTNLISAQVSIASPLPEDQLGFTSVPAISGSYSGGTLTLTGNATLANYTTVLRSVTYNNTSDAPNTSSRTISIYVSDGVGISNTITKTVTITPKNDPPVLINIESAALQYTEGSGQVNITNTLDITDPDVSTYTSALIQISANYQNGQDVLLFSNGFGLDGSWSPSNGELTLSGNTTLAQMRDALRSVKYENTSKNPSINPRTISIKISDGEASNTVTRTINLTNTNNPPVLSGMSASPINYTENGSPVVLAGNLNVTDDDNSTLNSATISFKSGFKQGQDILTYTNTVGITGNYNALTGVLTLNGAVSPAVYQGVLRSVKYENSSDSPDITNRVITFIVNDGTVNSDPAEITLIIIPVDDPPVASNLSIAAPDNKVGTVHTGKFDYSDPDGDPAGTHIYQWYRSPFMNGSSPVLIPGATAATYRPVKADGGSFIGFEVTPVDNDGTPGSKVRTTSFSYINAAPVASNVHIHAPKSIPGETISGRFNYFDKDSDPRGNAIYRWYRSNVPNPTTASPGTLISLDSTYRLRAAESGRYIWFRVSPVATVGSSPGDSVWSSIIGPIGSYTANISGSSTYCVGADMPINLTITGGESPYQATLHRTGTLPKDTVISDILLSSRVIHVKIPGNYTLVSVTDKAGDLADISASAPVELIVNPKSRALITGSTSICQGAETHTSLSLDFLSGTSPWNVTIRRGETATNDTIISGITNDPYIFTSRIIGPGPTRHRVVAISDANNCPGDTTSGSAWLRYKTSPVAVISGTDSICPGETALISVRLTSGTKPWSFTYQRNGVNAGTYANITGDVQTFTVSQQGTYTLSVVSDSSGSGCGTGQAVISHYTLPTASISGTATICEHTSTNLNVTLTGKSPWRFGFHRNFNQDSTEIENVVSNPRMVPVRKAGTYRLYEVIDRNGCKGTTSGSAVITLTPAPEVTISGLKKAYNYEESEIVTLTGTPAGGEFHGTGVYGNYFFPILAGLGTHNITYRYQESPGTCWGYDTVVVSVLESNAIITFEDDRTKYCRNDAPFLVTGVNLEDDIGMFTISGGAGIVDHGNNTATVYPGLLNPNRYVITYTYFYGGDPFHRQAEFDIGPAPVANFTWATECYHEGQYIEFKNSSSSSFGYLTDTSYFWNIKNLIIGSNYVYHTDSTRDIEYSFPRDGKYEIGLRIVNSYGCSDTAVKVLNLRPTHKLTERYTENFALHPLSWQSSGATAVNSWKLGNPSKHDIPPRGFSGAFNDTACWYTKITKIPSPLENSWVTSPCFDFSDSERPMLTMQIWRLFNSNRDGANIQFTADSGKTWQLIGEIGDGENWYNTSNIRGEPGGKDDGWSNYDGASNDNNWVRARHGLDFLKGMKDVQFRIAYGSDGTPQNNDGIAFDDFTISERTKMTLIEHFTNTGLSGGSKADSILDLFAGQYGMHAIDIQYHTSNPSGDPFYEDNPMIPTSRQFYYGISAVPYAVVDGGTVNRHLVDFKAESRPFDKNVIIKQSLSDSKFQISVNASRSGDMLNSSVRIIANQPLPLLELSVRTVVVESMVRGISGTNRDTVFRNIVRTMLPDAAGTTLYKSWSYTEDLEINDAWEIENVIDVSRLIVVAFIQNEATREIFNVAVDTVDILDSSGEQVPLPANDEGFNVYPNPAREFAIVQLVNRAENAITLELFNNTGSLVYSSKINRGENSAILPVDILPDGLYLMRLTTGNRLLGIRKLLVAK